MKCPRCGGEELVETESWGLKFFICPKCGASYDKALNLENSSGTEDTKNSKPTNNK